ncbi:MAG TPA: VacJ family lipoprotein [Burkholderiaceae bacterium]|nr:VacJ family lipoprotein [Burkholderiaceae bacterium]
MKEAGSLRLVAALLVLALGSGCAALGGEDKPQSAGQKLDPWEQWNRKAFAFNEDLDVKVLKPVATAYQKMVPAFLRTMVSNFIGNVEDGWSAVNHFLQGKGVSGLQMLTRFGTNTSLGFAGLIDIASEAGLERQPEDFGQTLGRWGLGAGAYFVWPVLGPSSVRDSLALPLDIQASPSIAMETFAQKAGTFTLSAISKRANLLGASRVIDEIALDKYTFVRDAYLARRRSLVYDGNPPDSRREDDSEPSADAPASPAVTDAAHGQGEPTPGAAR